MFSNEVQESANEDIDPTRGNNFPLVGQKKAEDTVLFLGLLSLPYIV